MYRSIIFVLFLSLLQGCGSRSNKDNLVQLSCISEIEVRARYHPIDIPALKMREDLTQHLFGRRPMGLICARDFSDTVSIIFFKDSILSAKTKEPLFAIYKPDTSLCLNSNYFSDMEILGVTSFSDHHYIGTVKKKLTKEIDNPKIIELLFQSYILRTFTHLDSKVCLYYKSDAIAEYDASTYSYVTTYETCSNHCQTDQSAFTVSIEKKTGHILVRPEELPKKGENSE